MESAFGTEIPLQEKPDQKRKGKRKRKGKHKRKVVRAKSSASLQKMPHEILLLITKDLPLATKLSLSETCRTFRNFLRDDSLEQARGLVGFDALRLLDDLVRNRPDHVTCAVCFRLHGVNEHDLPTTNNTERCDSSQLCRIQTNFRIPYNPTYQQVQLALKYRRLGNVHESYLSNLMKRYSTTRFFTLLAANSVLVKFMAKPKIVNGQYLLYTYWRFTGNVDNDRDLLYSFHNFGVCPHQRMGMSAPSSHRFRRTVDLVSTFPIYALGSCCPFCPTDFCVEHTKGRFLIQIWQNLGSEDDLRDGPWGIHWLRFVNIRGQEWEEIVGAPNLSHGIEAMYNGR